MLVYVVVVLFASTIVYIKLRGFFLYVVIMH